ncbi:carbohydrate-binding protein [Halobacteriaceae archaeon SHR40]|uniref:carbohydrate-binding protein n=1 Tax=Halovenus amylolytica TaxID=2500550 RepID=UPI000FE4389D
MDENDKNCGDEKDNTISGQNLSRRAYLKIGSVAALGAGGTRAAIGEAAATSEPFGESAWTVPGRIEAEDFDTGGEGVSYHDESGGNKGGAYRETDVDIEVVDDETGDYNVGWIDDGEWLAYTIDVTEPDSTYTIQFRVAGKNSSASIDVSLGGESVGTVDVPDTGDWQEWTTVELTDVTLPNSGEQILRLDFNGKHFNLNWIDFSTTGTGQQPFGGTAWPVPGRIEAEDFDTGGEGVAYHDTTKSNKGGAYRDTAVDIQQVDDDTGEYNVGWIEDSEWLEYTIDVTDADTVYDVQFRVAGKNSSASIDVSLDGESLGTVDVPDTGGWQEWTTVELADISPSSGGKQTLRVVFNSGDFNLNWVDFVASDTPANATPSVDSLDLSEVETDNSDAEFDASWAVSDTDSDLESISFTLTNTTANEVVDSTNVSISGESAKDTTRLVAGSEDGSGDAYETACTVTDSGGNSISATETATETEPSGQEPFGGSAWPLPGLIEAEDFDTGGEGVAYHDTSDGNNGGAYRETDVDIEVVNDNSGEYNVGWIEDSEWLEYTVDVTDTSITYDLLLRVASKGSAGSIDVLLDGQTIGTVDVPDTGGWQEWITMDIPNLSLSGGEQILHLDFNGGGFNLNWVDFVDSGATDDVGPTVDSLELFEVETDNNDAEFDAEWVLSDDDGNLSTVELTLTNLDTAEQMDNVSISVSGSADSDKTRLLASGEDEQKFQYEVECIVGDSEQNTDSATATETESEPSIGDGPIQPSADHPRYWEYNGQPVALIGGDQQDNPFQYVNSDDNHDAIAWLDTLASLDGNFVRNVMADRDAVKFGTDNIYAFENTESGYDLTQFNTEYFDRLDTYLAEAQSREIIVSIELWDGWDLYGDRWDAHPWNPANNINYSESATTLKTSWTDNPMQKTNPFFETVPSLNDDSTVRRYQEAFVRCVLDVTLHYDNVIYLPHNERRHEVEWSLYWANFLKDAAADAGREIYIGEMNDKDNHGSVQPSLTHDVFEFADVSQHSERSGEDHFNSLASSWDELASQPMPMNAVKNYDCSDDGAAMVWRCLMAGAAAARYHRGPLGDCDWGIGLQSKAQAHIEAQRLVDKAVGGAHTVKPHQEVDSLISYRGTDEAYMLADPGRVYAVYFPKRGNKNGSIGLDITDVSGDVTVEWRDIEGRSWTDSETLSGDVIDLTTPQSGHWAAIVKP